MKRRIILASAVIVVVFLIGALVLFKRIKGDNIKQKDYKTATSIQINNASAQELFQQAQVLETKGELLQAQAIYQDIINGAFNFDKMQELERRVGDLNIRIITSGVVTAQTIVYGVQDNDSLSKIAKKFNTTIELVKKSNAINSDVIKLGQKLRIWTGKFSCVIDKSQNILILKSGDTIIKKYMVSTGINNSTPIGVFHIINKLVNPTWYKAGAVVAPDSPENILGTRWMGFDLAGYGIHGTTDPANIGKQVTQGCVRLTNPEAEELYLLLPLGTEVIVVD